MNNHLRLETSGGVIAVSLPSPCAGKGFDSAFTGPGFHEGVAAFLAKRKPVFGPKAGQ